MTASVEFLQEVTEFVADSDTPSDHVLLKVSIVLGLIEFWTISVTLLRILSTSRFLWFWLYSNLTIMQIYALKALVKSFLPKNAHQRTRLPGLLKVLVKILACGEIADDMKTRSATSYREDTPDS